MTTLAPEFQQLLGQYRGQLQQSPQQATQTQTWFKQTFIYQSCAEIGGQLTRAETDQLLETGLAVGGKPLVDHFAVMVFARATEFLLQSVPLKRKNISEDFLVKLHQYSVLNFESVLSAGVISASFQVPYVLSEFVEWLRQQQGNELKIAAEAYLRLVKLEIFPERARQTAWLLINWLLLQAGCPFLVASQEQLVELQQRLDLALQGRAWEKYEEFVYQLVEQSLRAGIETLSAEQTLPASGLIKIGQLAQAVGESIPTIRHWTKFGLLQVSAHSPGGYQLYHRSAVQMASKIRELQREKRLTLNEIKKTL